MSKALSQMIAELEDIEDAIAQFPECGEFRVAKMQKLAEIKRTAELGLVSATQFGRDVKLPCKCEKCTLSVGMM
jgi:hypothetical protein